MRRWQDGELTLVVSDALVDEVTEKLLERRISEDRITELLALLLRIAEWVEVPLESVRAVVGEDPDDDPVLACAVVGQAGYLVTYDAHFDSLGGSYEGIRIMKAVPFLRELRGESERT